MESNIIETTGPKKNVLLETITTEELNSPVELPITKKLGASPRLTPTIFESWAMNFHEAGFKIIPVVGKIPAPGILWGHWINYEQTEAELWTMMARLSRSSLGEECGIAILGTDEICAVDIDTDEHLEEIIAALPKTPWRCRGKKGAKLIYRHNALPARPGTVFPVELLTKGRYFVVPPSVHSTDPSTGKITKYLWEPVDGVAPDGGIETIFSLDEIPMLSNEDFNKAIDVCRRYHIISQKKKPKPNEPGFLNEAKDSAREGRNTQLYHRCCWKLEEMALTSDSINNPETIEQLAHWLVDLDKKMHAAPWFTTDEANARFKGDPMPPARSMAARVVKHLKDRIVVGNATDIIAEKLKTTSESSIEFEKKIAAGLISSNFRSLAPTTEEWGALIPSEGILKDIHDVYCKNAINALPQFGLAAGLAAQSYAFSNIVESVALVRYKNSEGEDQSMTLLTSPALYSLIVAPSGAGKNAVKSTVNQTLAGSASGRQGLRSDIKSARGFMMAFEQSTRRSAIFSLDEFGQISESAEADKIGYALMAAYSSSKDYLGGSDAGDKKYSGKRIAGILPTIIAMSTPEGLAKTVTKKFNEKGGLNRWLFFVTTDKGKQLADILCEQTELEDQSSDSSSSSSSFFTELDESQQKIEDLMGSVGELLELPPVYDSEFRMLQGAGGMGSNDEYSLVCPILSYQVVPDSLDTLTHFGKILQVFKNPTELFSNLVEQFKIPLTPEQIQANDALISGLNAITARASEVINKLALHYCLSEKAVVDEILQLRARNEVPTRDRPVRLPYLRKSHYDVAAKVYELSLRGFIALLGENLFGDGTAGSGTVEAMQSDGSIDMAMYEAIRSRFWDERGMWKIKRESISRFLKRHPTFKKFYRSRSTMKIFQEIHEQQNGLKWVFPT